MKFGLDLAQHHLDWPEVLGRARFAEDSGFHGVWLIDHLMPASGATLGPCFEAFSTMAALAAATTRIRLGLLAAGVTYRHPAMLAAQAATIDHVSRGRLDLGIGAAWQQDEHARFGIPFPPMAERAERLEEALIVIKAVMTTAGATFDGRHYRLQNATYYPRPVQQPHPPIWVGAGGFRRTIPIAARHADAWHSFGSPRLLLRKAATLDGHARAAGRDPASITRATSLSISDSWTSVRATAVDLAAAGFSYLIVNWPAEGRPRVQQFVDQLLTELSAC